MYLTQPLHRSVQQFPERIATICGPRQFTYRQTLERVNRLASALRHCGVATEDRVAVMALNSDRYYQLLHATAWADAITVPVNIRWSVPEIAYSLNEAGCATWSSTTRSRRWPNHYGKHVHNSRC